MGVDLRRRILVLYGSQTGTAEETSERLAMQSRGSQFRCPVFALDDYDIQNLVEEEFLVIVCSTTGQGEPPDNMKKFWRFIMRKNLPNDCLSGIQFAVLGLGDSSYPKYNYVAKKIHRRFEMLGGEALLDVGLADDQHEWGPDVVIDEWSTKLWKTLIQLFPTSEGTTSPLGNSLPPPRFSVNVSEVENIKIKTVTEQDADSPFNQKNPFQAKLLFNRRVTSKEHFQDTHLISLDISTSSDSSLSYQPGDVVMVRPRNLMENVKEFLDILPFDSNALLTFEPCDKEDVTMDLPRPITLRQLAVEYLDFMSVPKRSFFQLLYHLSKDELEKEKLLEFGSPEGTDERYSYANRPRRNILEVLQDFHHTAREIPLDRIFDLFPLIRPRAFSIASSPTRHKGALHILVAVVRYKTVLHKPRQGLCSTWLSRLQPGDDVKIWLKKGGIRFPKENPCILIGPGTGIAPFRSAAHERHLAEIQDDVIFFGCRGRSMDFYFEEEWPELGVKVHTAFSRDQEEKVYVQHRVAEIGSELWPLIRDKKACVFVAGNSKNMPDQVKDAFLEIFRLHGNMSQEEAQRYCDDMQRNKRYQQETWS